MATPDQIFNDGEAYERSTGRWSRRMGARFLDWLALPAGLELIDVGCGNGAFTEELVDRCVPRSVVAIDLSEGQLSHARAHAGARPVDYRLGDAQAIPCGEASFDAATMALVIAFVPDPGKAVREMARVTRPGGLVASYMWDFEHGGVPSSPIVDEMSRMGILPVLPFRPENARLDVLEGLWTAAGLTDIETRALTMDAEFADFDEFWSSFQTGGAIPKLIASLAPDVRDKLRAAVRESVPALPDGRLVIGTRANAIRGRAAAGNL